MPAIGRGYLSIIKTIRSYRLSRTGAVVFSALSINVLIDFGPLPRGRPSPPILSSARFLPPLVTARRARVIDLHIYLLSFYCLVYTVPRYLYRIILGNGQVRSFIAGTVKRFDPIIPFFPFKFRTLFFFVYQKTLQRRVSCRLGKAFPSKLPQRFARVKERAI